MWLRLENIGYWTQMLFTRSTGLACRSSWRTEAFGWRTLIGWGLRASPRSHPKVIGSQSARGVIKPAKGGKKRVSGEGPAGKRLTGKSPVGSLAAEPSPCLRRRTLCADGIPDTTGKRERARSQPVQAICHPPSRRSCRPPRSAPGEDPLGWGHWASLILHLFPAA